MQQLSKNLDENKNTFKALFNKDDTLMMREFNNKYSSKLRFCLIYISCIIDPSIVDENIVEKIMLHRLNPDKNSNIIDYLIYNTISTTNVKKTTDLNKIILEIIDGNSILLVDGHDEAIVVGSKGRETRAIEEPTNEKVLRGPREGFTESIFTNLALLRRRLRTNDLKLEYRTLGSVSSTKACIAYLEGRADEKLLEEINRRLDQIEIDGLFDVKYIQELIDDNPYTVFELSGTTEKPDVLASKLLEGRIGILLDGTPFAMTVPYLFVEYFQTGEDYYANYYYTSINRMLRMWAFFFTTSTPALYLALVTYHKELIPTPLLLSIFAARHGVPFPTVIELLILLVVFETLREAGTRMPSDIGQALSIVGALVLGSAAVEARIVSMPTIIIIGFSGITALMIPNLSGSFIIIRVILVLLSALLGIYGYLIGVIFLLIHLCSLKSYGMPFLSTLQSIYSKDLKDTYIRGHRWFVAKKKQGE